MSTQCRAYAQALAFSVLATPLLLASVPQGTAELRPLDTDVWRGPGSEDLVSDVPPHRMKGGLLHPERRHFVVPGFQNTTIRTLLPKKTTNR